MVDLRHESPLAHRTSPETTYVGIREIPERGMIDLRGAAGDRKFMTAVKKILGVDLPKEPRTSTAWGEYKALWLSIDQWLILCPRSKVDELHAELVEALKGVHALVVDVSDMRAVIRLEGERCREVIMKGTSVDLTDDAYGPGSVRRMRFAEIAALLHVVDKTVIDVYVFRSYADYTWAFLEKAARKGSEVLSLPRG